MCAWSSPALLNLSGCVAFSAACQGVRYGGVEEGGVGGASDTAGDTTKTSPREVNPRCRLPTKAVANLVPPGAVA